MTSSNYSITLCSHNNYRSGSSCCAQHGFCQKGSGYWTYNKFGLRIEWIFDGNLKSLGLPTANTRIIGTPQMTFINQIMITHVHKIKDKPLMNSIAVKGYKNIGAKNSKGGHYEPSFITHGIPNHRNGHFVRPNKVALKYHDFKENVDLYAHVKGFNFVVKVKVETFEEYIISVFNYTLKDMASDLCHNYMLKKINCIFLEFTHSFCKCH